MTPKDLLLVAQARRHASTGTGRALREKSGLSLRETATALDVSVAGLWRWENGERTPRGDAAVRWARFLADLARSTKTAS